MDNFENVEPIYSTTEPENEDTNEYLDIELEEDMSEFESEVTVSEPEPELEVITEPIAIVKNVAAEAKSYENDKVVPVYASKNLFKYGVGELKIGYNIVTQKEADFWTGHKSVRLATSEEVAKEYLN